MWLLSHIVCRGTSSLPREDRVFRREDTRLPDGKLSFPPWKQQVSGGKIHVVRRVDSVFPRESNKFSGG